MAISLKNKKVLITGSTDGLGRQTAIEIAKQGASIILQGKNEDKVNNVISELKIINPKGDFKAVICDFDKPEAVKKYFHQIEELDILINNTGIWSEEDLSNIDPERIIQLVNVNLASYMVVTKLLLPVLQESGFGQILNIISVTGYEVPEINFRAIYSATKFGLQGFAESMASEFDNENIRVMGFYPGGMSTHIAKKEAFDYKENATWLFDIESSAEAILFMLTRNSKINISRMDLINHVNG